MPPGKDELVLAGLNLLRLLVQNRIAEFHTELELLPHEVQPFFSKPPHPQPTISPAALPRCLGVPTLLVLTYLSAHGVRLLRWSRPCGRGEVLCGVPVIREP